MPKDAGHETKTIAGKDDVPTPAGGGDEISQLRLKGRATIVQPQVNLDYHEFAGNHTSILRLRQGSSFLREGAL